MPLTTEPTAKKPSRRQALASEMTYAAERALVGSPKFQRARDQLAKRMAALAVKNWLAKYETAKPGAEQKNQYGLPPEEFAAKRRRKRRRKSQAAAMGAKQAAEES